MKTNRKQGYWLLKSEPDTFSIDDLKQAPQQVTLWEGVRNYQARNMLRDEIQPGDLAFFYHSSCPIPAIMGIVEVLRAGLPDLTALDPQSPYFDPKASPDNPRWYLIEVKLKKQLPMPITLVSLKNNPALNTFSLVKKGNRLSVLPMTSNQWQTILSMAK